MTGKPERDRELGLSLKSFGLFLLLLCGRLCSAESQTVVITKGGTYAGCGFAPSGVDIAIETTEPVTIELSTVGAYYAITNVVNGQYYPGVNIAIKDCYLYSTSPTNTIRVFRQPALKT
jgi:hypothetical protein